MALKPYLQLVRLPNLFTAAADSLAGWLLVQGSFREPGHWAPLVAASACTYAGGIVLNDVFDVEVDRSERPNRPLPSGRVGYRTAVVLGVGLLAAGLVLAVLSATRLGLVVEVALVASVLAYDAGLRRTPLGPEVMGACRGLNLLLGMSHAAGLGGPWAWLAAGSYGLFVTGVTWISRSEVESGRWKNIALGVVLQNLAIVGLIAVGLRAGGISRAETGETTSGLLGLAALMLIGTAVNWRSIDALRHPAPPQIQRAVKFGIMSLVWLHFGVLLAVRGPAVAMVVALFWIPAALTGRWIYST